MDVRMPDGTVVKGVPDGITQEELAQRVQSYQMTNGTPSQRRGENVEANLAKLPPPRNVLSSVVQGGIDTAGAIAQGVSRGASALGLPEDADYPFIAGPKVVDAAIERARGQTNKTLGEPNPGGIDIVRGGSSALLSAPYMGSVGTAPSMLGRGVQAARAGAVGGALQPVKPGQDGMGFAQEKALQVGTGAAVGGAVQPALELGGRAVASGASWLANRARGAVTDASNEVASRIATESLRAQGVRMDQLSKSVQDSIIKDAQEALKKYGGVNAAALARQADFKDLGVDPLKPWVTRDPVEWGQYKNLEPSKDAGEPLIRARAELDKKLVERLNSLRGGNTGGAYESGRVVEDALGARHQASKDRVSALYDTFAAKAPDTPADGRRFTQNLLSTLDKEMAHEPLPENLRSAINKIAQGEMPATPSVLYQLQKAANRSARSGGDAGYAAGLVSKAVDTELDDFARDMSAVGPQMKEAADALKAARAAHRNLKMTEEAIPALRDVAEGKFAAEDFFNRYVLGGDVKEVAAMWSSFDQRFKQPARSQLIDYLKKAAIGSGSDEAAVFRQSKFTEAIASPGMEQKIKILLGDKGLEEVKRVARAGEAAIRTPSGTRYNTSGSAAELMNLMRRGSGVPFLGPMVTEPMQKLMAQSQATGMMSKAGPGDLGRSILDPATMEEFMRRMQQGAGLLSPALGMGAAGELTR